MSSDPQERTIRWYDDHAAEYVRRTAGVDVAELTSRFIEKVRSVNPAGRILDVGAGSGRDSRVFLDAGFDVEPIDASQGLASLAEELIGVPVRVLDVRDLYEAARYDGVWANAVLVHIPEAEIPRVLDQLWIALRPGGYLFFSFAKTVTDQEARGRFYTVPSVATLEEWIDRLPLHGPAELWESRDALPGRDRAWINVLVQRAPSAKHHLIVGDNREHGEKDTEESLLPHLQTAILEAETIEIAVSFIRSTGLDLIADELANALEKNGTSIRVLTSDYLGITDPAALHELAILKSMGADVRVYETPQGGSFHMKAYIFVGGRDPKWGRAFVGSSNISRQALRDGLEWNYRVDYPGDSGFLETRARFARLFDDSHSRPLTHDWIREYENRRKPPVTSIAPGSDEVQPQAVPNEVQRDALIALDRTRAAGYRRGLVVMATGIGKTWLAAFDIDQVRAERVLFVAHRQEILFQAARTFQRIRPDATIGFWQSQVRDRDAQFLFASVQTIGREAHLDLFEKKHFDYIVVDEFHHAAAPSYRRLLGYFRPGFLLGLTATPDRTDNASILAFCDDNLVFSYPLLDGIRSKHLVPFRYYGIQDIVDYGPTSIPWRNGRFDPEALEAKLATNLRAEHVFKNWADHSVGRTLSFCASRRHADFMADYFRKKGVTAVAVHGTSHVSREEAIRGLADGRLQVVFSVDLFSEGVDVPEIDSILMLRPTESSILFLQQLGRGLRLSPAKKDLLVLDFVANHKSFLHKPMALMGATMTHQALSKFASDIEKDRLELPPGCFINFDLEFIDFLKHLSDGTLSADYQRLKEAYGRRPTLLEFWRGGGAVGKLKSHHGEWFGLVENEGDLSNEETEVAQAHSKLLVELFTTSMTKSFKMILLGAFSDLDGWAHPPTIKELATASWSAICRFPQFLGEIGVMDSLVRGDVPERPPKRWERYWISNPVNAWIGGNLENPEAALFQLDETDGVFRYRESLSSEDAEILSAFVQEYVDFRIAKYAEAKGTSHVPKGDGSSHSPEATRQEVFSFDDLGIACGHFRTGTPRDPEKRVVAVPPLSGTPFLARATGDSMNGGESPVRDADIMLLEYLSPPVDPTKESSLGQFENQKIVLERSDDRSRAYLLRQLVADASRGWVFRANNPSYQDVSLSELVESHSVGIARVVKVVSPLEFEVGKSFMRQDIPALFGEEYNVGSWNVGHVRVDDKTHVLLVSINKQGLTDDHRFVDRWDETDRSLFMWQSQRQTTTASRKGREIINHAAEGRLIHLFVRENRKIGGRGAPFVYHGVADYLSHETEAPINFRFRVRTPLPD